MTTALRRHRRARRLRQSDLAQLLRVDQTTVSLWESGKTRPQPRNAADLEHLFELPLDELLTHENGGPKAAADARVDPAKDTNGGSSEG